MVEELSEHWSLITDGEDGDDDYVVFEGEDDDDETEEDDDDVVPVLSYLNCYECLFPGRNIIS